MHSAVQMVTACSASSIQQTTNGLSTVTPYGSLNWSVSASPATAFVVAFVCRAPLVGAFLPTLLAGGHRFEFLPSSALPK